MIKMDSFAPWGGSVQEANKDALANQVQQEGYLLLESDALLSQNFQ